MCMGVLPAGISVPHAMPGAHKGTGTRVPDSGDLPRGCWELNSVLWKSSQRS